MRLLDTESLQSAIVHSGITLDLDIHDFYGDLWRLIKTAETVERDADMLALEKELRGVFHEYYRQTGRWLFEQEMLHADKETDPAWRYQAMKARDTLIPFQKQLQRYVLCYMHINRALIRSRQEIDNIGKLYPLEESHSRLKVNEATGMLVARAFRQKKMMMDKRQRLTALSHVLNELQTAFAALRTDLFMILPAETVERAYVSFRAALRQGHFDEARRIAHEWQDKRLILNPSGQKIVAMNADRIIYLVTQHAEGLKVQDGYMMEPSDIALLFSFLKADEARVDKFLRKYMLPFMTHKLKQLLAVAYRLGRIGSLEGLLVIHARLLGGLARPMEDMAQIKRYEEEVAGRAAFLVQSGFPDLSHIFHEAEVVFDQIRVFFVGAHIIGGGIEAPREL